MSPDDLEKARATSRSTTGRPTNVDRGIDVPERPFEDSIRRRGDALDFTPVYDLPTRQAALGPLQAQIQAMFRAPTRANVTDEDLRSNDKTFANPTFAKVVRSAATEFDVPAAVLAEHLVAETRISSHLTPKTTVTTPLTTTVLGLDDFVQARKRIEALVPGARTLPKGKKANPFTAETDVDDFNLGRITREELDRRSKPQLEFPLVDGVRASAAYIKWKEAEGRLKIGDAPIDALVPEVRAELLRLLVNPGRPGQRTGTNHWLSLVKNGQLGGLFDFSKRTARESKNDVRRRATIHTARTLHAAKTFFPESPF